MLSENRSLLSQKQPKVEEAYQQYLNYPDRSLASLEMQTKPVGLGMGLFEAVKPVKKGASLLFSTKGSYVERMLNLRSRSVLLEERNWGSESVVSLNQFSRQGQVNQDTNQRWKVGNQLERGSEPNPPLPDFVKTEALQMRNDSIFRKVKLENQNEDTNSKSNALSRQLQFPKTQSDPVLKAEEVKLQRKRPSASSPMPKEKDINEMMKYKVGLKLISVMNERELSKTEINHLVFCFGENYTRRKNLKRVKRSEDAGIVKEEEIHNIQKEYTEDHQMKGEDSKHDNDIGNEKLRGEGSLEPAVEQDKINNTNNADNNNIHNHDNTKTKFNEDIKSEPILGKCEPLRPVPSNSDPLPRSTPSKPIEIKSQAELQSLFRMLQKDSKQINIKTINANINTINNYSAVKNSSKRGYKEPVNAGQFSFSGESPKNKTLKDLMNNFANYYIDPETRSIFLKVTSFERRVRRDPKNRYSLMPVAEFIDSYNASPEVASVELKDLDFLHLQNLVSKNSHAFSIEKAVNAQSQKNPKHKHSHARIKNIIPASARNQSKTTSTPANPKKKKSKRSSSRHKPRAHPDPTKGCKCKKSKCLRLHCVCFREERFCNESCKCAGCYNRDEFIEIVDEVKTATKTINSEAFESRFVEVRQGDKINKVTKGCSCSKNNCLKNYCECRKNSMPCTPLCKCENCKNEKIDIQPKLASKLCKRKSRKKMKIVFKTGANSELQLKHEGKLPRSSGRRGERGK